MPPWSVTEPAGGRALKTSDDKLRENFAYLEQALAREHVFPGTEDPGGTSGTHTEGAARAYMSNSAVALATISQASDDYTGSIVYWTDNGRVWFCEDGSTDDWREIEYLGSALTLAEHVTLLTGKTLIGPTGEEWLKDDHGTPLTVDPIKLAHAPLYKLEAPSLKYDTDIDLEGVLPITILESDIWDFSARRGVSRVLLLAVLDFWSNQNNTYTFGLYYVDDAVPQALIADTQESVIGDGSTSAIRPKYIAMATISTVTAAANQRFRLVCSGRNGVAGQNEAELIKFAAIDLGEV